MIVNKTEESLAKYHLLHFVLGAIFAAVLLAIPKLIGILLCTFLAALILPAAILPDFRQNKWFDRAAVVAGALAVGLFFHFLHKL